MNYKTTAKNFDLFKSECHKWMDFFGLNGYGATFVHDNSGDLAGAQYDIIDRWVTFRLGKNWGETKPTVFEIKSTAFHEVAHLFIGKLGVLARARFITDSEVIEESEHIVRVLENKIFPVLNGTK